MLPERVRNLAEARRLWRERADHFASFLLQGDPLADDLVDELSHLPVRRGKRLLDKALTEGIEAVPSPPAALARFFAQIDKVPLWVDSERLDRGGATFLRSGPFTVMTLMCGSLPFAYASPAGNKPLIFSGRLVKMAPLRLAETGRFFLATCQPGGLRRFSEGFRITVRVRLMHAQVRHLLLGSDLWKLGAWGVPINQADMAGTNLLFSVVPLEGLRRLGFRFTRDEAESVMHLWRYSGYLMGVDDRLLCATESEGVRLGELVHLLQGPPDEDSRALIRCLMEEAPASLLGIRDQRMWARWLVDLCYDFSRSIIGDELAEALGYPRRRRSHLLRMLRFGVGALEPLRRWMPWAQSLTVALGVRCLEQINVSGLGGSTPRYSLPQKLHALTRLDEDLRSMKEYGAFNR
jgi:hypothetical protein